jgi:hypothetical protein
MANPFGIEQVDIPGLIGMHQGLKRQRMSDLYMKRQMDRQDRADQKEVAIEDAYRGAIRKRPPPSTGIGISQGLRKLSSLPELVGMGGSYTAPSPVQDTVGSAASVDSAALASAPQMASPIEAPRPTMPDVPAPPSYLLPDAEHSDDGIDFSPGLSLNREGLDKLADLDPKGAYSLLQMDDEARARAFKRVSENVEFVSQIIGAVRGAPEAQRPTLYQHIRGDLASKGIQGLPEQWSEEEAEARQRMALTAMQAFQDDRAERRFEQDVADDDVDNERADRNTASLISDRDARRGLTSRGQDLSDSRGRRGQDIASSDRRRGQDISDKRLRETGGNRGARRASTSPGSSAPVPASQAGGNQTFTRTATDPSTGKKVGWNGTRWVPAN